MARPAREARAPGRPGVARLVASVHRHSHCLDRCRGFLLLDITEGARGRIPTGIPPICGLAQANPSRYHARSTPGRARHGAWLLPGLFHFRGTFFSESCHAGASSHAFNSSGAFVSRLAGMSCAGLPRLLRMSTSPGLWPPCLLIEAIGRALLDDGSSIFD